MKSNRMIFGSALLFLGLLPGFAFATIIKLNLTGDFGLAGSGSLTGTVIFDDTNPAQTVFALVDVDVSDGDFVTIAPASTQTLGSKHFDQGWQVPIPADFALAVWVAAEVPLTGDRLLYLDFAFFGGLNLAGGSAVATEFICQVDGCNNFNDTSVRRQGVISYSVPEPTTFGLLGAGLLGLAFMRRKQVA